MSLEESRFTPARPWCLHPEYWHSPDSEATEMEVTEFLGALVRMIQPEYVVETGTYHGHTALEIGLALRDNGHGRLVTIEANTECYETAFANLEGGANLPVTLIHGNTMDFVPEQDIDFAFFDSWQEGRILEFNRFYRLGKLKRGAIVAFHDTAPHHKVRETVLPTIGCDADSVTSDPSISIIDFHTPRGLIIGQVL
jgi:predicted O-methyltransferase YrrM